MVPYELQVSLFLSRMSQQPSQFSYLEQFPQMGYESHVRFVIDTFINSKPLKERIFSAFLSFHLFKNR